MSVPVFIDITLSHNARTGRPILLYGLASHSLHFPDVSQAVKVGQKALKSTSGAVMIIIARGRTKF